MLSSVEWSFLDGDVVAFLLAVLVTNRRYCPRILKILARNGLVVSFFLLSYECVLSSSLTAPRSVSSSVSTPVLAPASGDSIVGGPSLSASFVNRVLARAGSPAVGTGQALYDLSVKYRVDDAYALSTFQHESTYGKYGYGAADLSLGNIICAGYATCNGRFRRYVSWEEGYEDFYRLIAREYVARGCRTLTCIVPVYAPPSENNTDGYIQTVRMQIVRFRVGLLS